MADTVSEDELRHYLREERWSTYRSAPMEAKKIYVRVGGAGFRVTVKHVEIYKGQNLSDAVRAYNEADC